MKRSTAELDHLWRALRGWAAALAILAAWPAAPTAAQVPKRAAAPLEETRAADVRDAAGLFQAESIAAARKTLRDLETKTSVPTIITTVETLDGGAVELAALRMAKESGIEGLFILISKKERKIQIFVSPKYQGEEMKTQREAIRAAFVEGFRQGHFDLGLKLAVSAIAESLLRAQRAGELSGKPGIQALSGLGGSPSRTGWDAGPLVLRNQVRLTLPGARVLIAAAQAKAHALKLNVNIAVVDDGGHLIAFERMDGARPASGYTAITKATSAATFRQNSGPLPSGPDPLLNLSLQLAASSSGGKITSLLGGVPVSVDGQVIGAVGVGGGTGEQDTQIATAGVAALLEKVGSELPERAKRLDNPK